MHLRHERGCLLVHTRMVGDHLSGECFHLSIARFRFGELAGVDVDLIGGNDNSGDLRIGNVLRDRRRDRQEHQSNHGKHEILHPDHQ